jgi:hypothetical protein
MKISIEDLHQAVDIVGQAAGPEAAIVAQFVADLAITAQFNASARAISPEEAHRLLRLRIARHASSMHCANNTVH